jgi:hypothetical protein
MYHSSGKRKNEREKGNKGRELRGGTRNEIKKRDNNIN